MIGGGYRKLRVAPATRSSVHSESDERAGMLATATAVDQLATAISKQFHHHLDRAGLPQRRFHDLRHSCATLLLVQGLSPRVVMEVLGHSQIGLTMNTYSHVIPELRREAADRMDKLLSRSDDRER